jgi:site-specific recombinase XerD
MMNFQNEFLKTLTEQAIVYLENKNKAKSTISKYVWIWQQIDKYLANNNISDCNKGVIIEYIQHKFGDKKISDLTHYQKNCMSIALNLIQFMETGKMFETIEYVPKEKPKLTGEIGSLMLDFIMFKKSRRLAEKTLSNYKWNLYCFQKHMNENEILELQQISPLVILSYCSQLSPEHLGAKHLALCIVRSFLRYAYDEKKIKTDLSLVVPHDNYKRQPKLPSIYSKKEVKMILASVDRSTITGKRNYAILLLIVRLGMRASDIRNLSFENIKWSMNLISFEQCKTGQWIELPLPADVGEAIIDYLKYGRPETDERYIFVEHVYPYGRLQMKGVSKIANHAICYSGIDIGNRKHGSHALRHTMAGFLLEGKTPVTIISELLGHSNIQSTMCYLRVDVESLRQCALDVPIVDVEFYEQKGGAFYE